MGRGRDAHGRTDKRHPLAVSGSGSDPATHHAVPRVGVLRNPRSHGNRRTGQAARATGQGAEILLREPARRDDIEDALRDFAERGIDLLVVDGGDGTIRDVLTAGLAVFGSRFPTLAVLARGKTNALAIDLGIGRHWDVGDAVDAWQARRLQNLRPMVVNRADVAARPVAGFVLGAGAFTRALATAADAHRIGAFGSLAVGLTMGWGLLQIFLGGARSDWRRGTALALELSGGPPPSASTPQSGERRRILLAATTLRRMPLGLRPFGRPRDGLKLLLLEQPRRLLLLAVPAVLSGWRSAWLERAGLWRGDATGFTLTLPDDGFVLDGETYPPGRYTVTLGAPLRFVVP